MSSRIVRGEDRVRGLTVRTVVVDAECAAAVATLDELHIAEKQAFERGYTEGERVGREMGERMIETAVKRYDRTVAEMAAAHTAVVDAMETKTVQLALEIARKVIQREVHLDQDLVCALATVALRRVQSHQTVTLRVSHADYSRIRGVLAESNSLVSVVEESSLERGDFRIDTAQTHLDARIQSQVEILGRAMLEE